MSDTTRDGCRSLMVEMLDDRGLDDTLEALARALQFKADQLLQHGHGLAVISPWLVADALVTKLMVDLRHLKL